MATPFRDLTRLRQSLNNNVKILAMDYPSSRPAAIGDASPLRERDLPPPGQFHAKTLAIHKWVCACAALAGLTGAGGMILSAANAHLVTDPRLNTAANLMLLHAVAALALCSLALAAPRRRMWLAGAAGTLLSGCLLFACDMALRAILGTRLFPMAAPLGGSLLILGWMIAAFSAVVAFWPSHTGTKDQD